MTMTQPIKFTSSERYYVRHNFALKLYAVKIGTMTLTHFKTFEEAMLYAARLNRELNEEN